MLVELVPIIVAAIVALPAMATFWQARENAKEAERKSRILVGKVDEVHGIVNSKYKILEDKLAASDARVAQLLELLKGFTIKDPSPWSPGATHPLEGKIEKVEVKVDMVDSVVDAIKEKTDTIKPKRGG